MKDYSSLLFALLAFALSVMAFFSKGGVSIDNGVLALVGICATLIVGIHVIDEIKIRQIEKKTEELAKITEETNKQRQNQNTIIRLALGLSCFSFQPQTTLKECWKAIEMAITGGSNLNTNTCIDTTKKVLKQIENNSEIKEKVKKSKTHLPNEISIEVKSSELYGIYKKHLEEILAKFAELQPNTSS